MIARQARLIAATAVVTALAVLHTTPVQADAHTTSAASGQRSPSCAINLVNGAFSCADTAEEANKAVTAGTTVVRLAIFYENIHYSPSAMSQVLGIWGRPCTTPTTDIEYTIADLRTKRIRDTTWDDRISSVRTYNQCDVKFFDGTHGQGAATGFIDSHSDLRFYGAGWNDRASSLRLS